MKFTTKKLQEQHNVIQQNPRTIMKASNVLVAGACSCCHGNLGMRAKKVSDTSKDR